MADDNQFIKYSRYAIGEIVLVVIGILIALSINNWNEQRKNNAKILSFFEEVQKDLLKDISHIEQAISTYKTKDSLAYLVLNNKLTRDDYEKPGTGQELFVLIADFVDFQFNKNGYANLKLNINDISLINKPVYDTLATLYEQNVRGLEDQNKRIGKYVYENIKYLSNNKEWFSLNYSSRRRTNDTIIDYFLHDPFYKNRVKEFQILIIDAYKEYKIDAIIAYELLGEITKSDQSLPDHLKNYIVDSETLKQYAGIYKPKDSVRYKTKLTVSEKGIFYGNQRLSYTKGGDDKFSIAPGYDQSLTFQRNDKAELIGVNFNNYELTNEFIKTN